MTLPITHATTAVPARTPFPTRWFAAIGLGGAWVAIALAETLMTGGQDQLSDVGMIAANRGILAGAGLLHLLAGALFILALIGLAPLIWRSRLGKVAIALTVVVTACIGGFAMVHLLAIEAAADGLDPAVMNQFLVQQLDQSPDGPWFVPVAFAALVGPVAVLLTTVAMARLGLAPWVAPLAIGIGAGLHMAVPTEIAETASHWIIALGLILAARHVASVRPDRTIASFAA